MRHGKMAERRNESSKHQHPSTREAPNSNHQPRQRMGIEIWNRVLPWCLDVGAWSFLSTLLPQSSSPSLQTDALQRLHPRRKDRAAAGAGLHLVPEIAA